VRYPRRMDKYVTTQEQDVTEIEERIETQRERSEIMRREFACECPDKSCPVEHES